MSEIGYYRYKFSDVVEGVQYVELFINGSKKKTCTIIGKPFCLNSKLLKYLNKDGQYLFFPFNQYWQQQDSPKLIGKTNHFVTSILDSQSSERNVGYKNERQLTLTAERVSLDELERLADIYISPRVYLYVGSGTTDNLSDWVLVSISGDGINHPRKANFKKVTVTITLPEYYAVTKV